MKLISLSIILLVGLIVFVQIEETEVADPPSYKTIDYPGQSGQQETHSVAQNAPGDRPESPSAESGNDPSSHNLGNAWGEAAYQTLKASDCATCHTRSLKTARAGALEIFDLDNTPWHSTLKEEHLEGLSIRIIGRSDFTEEEQESVRKFMECFSKDC